MPIDDEQSLRRGQRNRIIEPAPPAPVPKKAPTGPRRTPHATGSKPDRSLLGAAQRKPVAAAATPTATKQSQGDARATDRDVVRAGGSMAVATLFSRITGFLRNVLIGATVGASIGSAFNTANTLPNLITEIVLGAVLTSLVVPVLVRAEKEDPDHGAAFIRRLMTVSFTILLLVTVMAVAGASLLTRLTLGSDGQVNIVQATSFAYLLLPQIIFYGVFALFMAILNTKGVFKPGAWAPVANNVVVLVVMGLYWLLPGGLTQNEQAGVTDPHILLLGLGTTLGVVIQAAIMVPYLKKAGIDLRPLWGIDDRLKQFAGMALAIIVYVGISQAGFIITMRIASAADARAPMLYSQAWLLLQVPYGIIGVTMLTAIMPRLSRNAAEGDDRAVVRDLTLATKITFLALIPVIIFMTAFGTQIAEGLFAYGAFDEEAAGLLGLTLSFSAFTLIPYALVLLHLRVFYAREEAWTPTFIIAGITGTKVVLSAIAPYVASGPDKVVILLGAANGMGFVAGAVIGAFLLHRKLGQLNGLQVFKTVLWAVLASCIGAAAGLVLDRLIVTITGGSDAGGSVGYLVRTFAAGIAFLAVTGVVLSRSGLKEVGALGNAFQRIPGLNKILRPGSAPANPDEQQIPAEVMAHLVALEPFTTTPVAPPMSAGVVHGPRLVPGAPVADGRYRLLADHGSVPGARFWQALDTTTGKEAALIFVNTVATADSPAAAAAAARRVARNTSKLASLSTPSIPRNIAVTAYRSGCLVACDWIKGRPLEAVAEAGANPLAAAWSVSYLAKATQAAHDIGIPVGLEHRSRIRIDTSGRAVLAFPAVLPLDTPDRDIRSLGATLLSLTKNSPEHIPPRLKELTNLAISATPGPPSGEEFTPRADGTVAGGKTSITAGELAVALRHITAFDDPARDTPVQQGAAATITVKDEMTPSPTDTRGGFGSAGYSHKGLFLLGTAVAAAVVAAAALAVLIISVVSGDSEKSPITPKSIDDVTVKTTSDASSATSTTPSTSATPATSVVTAPQPKRIHIQNASEWQPAGSPPDFADNPQQAPLAADGNPHTAWHTDRYLRQFAAPPNGAKLGTGVLFTTFESITPTTVTITTDHPGSVVAIYAAPPTTKTFAQLDEAQLLGVAPLQEKTTTIPVTATTSARTTDRILVWVSALPFPDAATINEVTITGIF